MYVPPSACLPDTDGMVGWPRPAPLIGDGSNSFLYTSRVPSRMGQSQRGRRNQDQIESKICTRQPQIPKSPIPKT